MAQERRKRRPTAADQTVDIQESSSEDTDDVIENSRAKKKKKISTPQDSFKGLATAFLNIMSRQVNQGAPVLAEQQEVYDKLEKGKANNLVRRVKKKRSKLRLDLGHQPVDSTDPKKVQMERELKKIATRGVVRLFNTVREYQLQHLDELGKDAAPDLKEVRKKWERKPRKLLGELSKEEFVAMLQKKKSGDMPVKPKPVDTGEQFDADEHD
mmetsp:Transcript_50979/g.111670  ORF Transcript_50979/g.111670 Transcript_50979/m.111670 type:complete len:212 (+) Transcript_50979:67-702(+)